MLILLINKNLIKANIINKQKFDKTDIINKQKFNKANY
jgi:hypothetical protein